MTADKKKGSDETSSLPPPGSQAPSPAFLPSPPPAPTPLPPLFFSLFGVAAPLPPPLLLRPFLVIRVIRPRPFFTAVYAGGQRGGKAAAPLDDPVISGM